MSDDSVGIFFWVQGKLLVHKVSLELAEEYGDFKIYAKSHWEIWEKYYGHKYMVDYDYFPRGRVVYNVKSKQKILYYDRCMEGILIDIEKAFGGTNYVRYTDGHYQCRNCNENYCF